MNPNDENQPQPWIDPALEARVVAHVLGETSAFEAAELDRHLADNPELALFRRRITAIHDLVGTATHPDAEPLRLAPDRRAQLLAAIGTVTAEPSETVRVLSPTRRNWSTPRILVPLAACLIVTAIAIPLLTTTTRQTVQGPADFEGGEGGFVDEAFTNRENGSGFTASERTPTSELMAMNTPAAPASKDIARAERSRSSSVLEEQLLADEIAEQLPSRNLAAAQNGAGPAPEFEGFINYGSPIVPVEGVPGDVINQPILSQTARPAAPSASREIDARGRAVTIGESRTTIVDKSAIDAKDDQFWNADLSTGWDSVYMFRGVDVSPPEDELKMDLDSVVDEIGRKSELSKTKQAPFQSETLTADEPISTFSLHVGDVSFQLAADALARGEAPDPARIRPEEFTNAFDYNDPSPAAGEPVACRVEQSAHPFLQQRNLVRIAVKVAAAGRATGQPLRLTFLLDTSGSMERADRAATVRQALETLAPQLGPDDRVNLVGFARTPRLLAENVPGDQAAQLADIAARTPAAGGTNLETALALASELATKQFLPAAQNRIVLLTDGAANLGDADPDRLAAGVTKTRQLGISFDAAGVGAKGLNDTILEALTRRGDGRYYFLNTPQDAEANFARQLAGALRPAAENVKVQVVFNPDRVARYRLLGFDEHRLKAEDFRNDQVDAAELSAEEAGVALYQIEPIPEGRGEVGEVFVRFRDPATDQMVERSWTIPYDPNAPTFDQASPSIQLAGAATLLADHLRGDERVDLESLTPTITNLRQAFPNQARVQTLTQMLESRKN